MDPRMRFIIDADNRASAEMDRAAQSARNLGGAARQAGQEYSRLSDDDIAKAAAQFDLLYGSATKATAGTKAMGEAAHMGALGIGRIRNELGTLTGRLTGTNTAIDRVTGALGAFAVGDPVVIGVLLGISAMEMALQAFGKQSDDLADRLDKNMKKMRESAMDAQIAMGDLQLAKAAADVKDAQQALARAQAGENQYNATLGGTVHTVNQHDVDAAKKQLAAANAEAFQANQYKAGLDYQSRNDADRNAADSLAILIRSNNATHAERQRAIALMKKDQAEIEALGASQTDNVRRLALIHDVGTLDSALNPKSATHAAERLAAARFRQTLTDAGRFSNEFIRSLPKSKSPWEVYDEQQKNGPMSARDIAQGAQREIAGDTGQGRANNAIYAAYQRQQLQQGIAGVLGTHPGGLPPDIQARMDAIAKESKSVEEAEQKKRALMKETYRQTMAAATEFVDVTTSSHNRAVKAVGTAANAVRRLAIGAEASRAAVESARAFGKVPGALAAGDFPGAALWAASGTQLAAAAALGFKESLGGGGSGGGGGGGAGGGDASGVGTFRPDSSSQNGGVTINLITKHPGSPDVVNSIMYQINRSQVLKVPPIEIPPAAGLIATSA